MRLNTVHHRMVVLHLVLIVYAQFLRVPNLFRDVIAFPKNNMGRDIMIDAPSPISNEQRDELSL